MLSPIAIGAGILIAALLAFAAAKPGSFLKPFEGHNVTGLANLKSIAENQTAVLAAGV